METNKQQEIAVREPQNSMLVEIDRVQKELIRFKDHAHILSPMARTDWDTIMPAHRVSMRVARISADPKDREVYELEETKGKFALTKEGLQALDHLAGLRWVDSKVYYNPAEPLVARGMARAEIQDMDGLWRGAVGNRVVDLRDGSPEANKMIAAWHRKLQREKQPIPQDTNLCPQLARARMYAVQNAESKAKNRVRRELLGLQSSFTPEELALPFVILRLVPVIDMTDPLVRQIVIMQQLGISAELYQSAAKSLQSLAPEQPTDGATKVIVEPPNGPAGLEVPTAPEATTTTVVSDETVTDKLEAERQSLRAEQIKRITKLYLTKTGKERPKDRPPLETLDDDQLDQIEDYMKGRKDVKALV